MTTSRRKALKDFYKLQQSQQTQLSSLTQKEVDQLPSTPAAPVIINTSADFDTHGEPEEDISLENFDEFIKKSTFLKLITVENTITNDLNSNQSEIKSIIYNNYYELIKIDDTLKELTHNNDRVSVVSNLQLIKSNLSKISRLQVLPDESETSLKPPSDKQQLSIMINQLLKSRRLTSSQLSLVNRLRDVLKVDQNESFFLQVNELK